MTPNHATSDDAFTVWLASGQHSSEKTLQQGQVGGDPLPDMPSLEIELQTTQPVSMIFDHYTNQPI